jgi:hypothetical protein
VSQVQDAYNNFGQLIPQHQVEDTGGYLNGFFLTGDSGVPQAHGLPSTTEMPPDWTDSGATVHGLTEVYDGGEEDSTSFNYPV